MARGDVTVFDEAKAQMLEGGWLPTDSIYIAICDNTVAPAASTATPMLGDFTEVSDSGSYTAGGTGLGTIATCVTEASGTMKFDSSTNPSWSQHASNDSDAYWGIIYNKSTSSNSALAYVDLSGAVDMSAGDLTITWHASGIFTIA